jgi:hypothetical protein
MAPLSLVIELYLSLHISTPRRIAFRRIGVSNRPSWASYDAECLTSWNTADCLAVLDLLRIRRLDHDRKYMISIDRANSDEGRSWEVNIPSSWLTRMTYCTAM